MSGPVDERVLGWVNQGQMGIQVIEGRQTEVGGMEVVRVLPTKGRRTIGGWCFVDLIIPPDAADPHPLEIGPHPHIGLATVTWLFSGEALHGDSLGTEQVIRPGQLNLMTAGHGIAHAELSAAAGVSGPCPPNYPASTPLPHRGCRLASSGSWATARWLGGR